MMPLPLSELVAELGGERRGEDVLIGSVGIDSRHIGPDGLFVALPGSRTDGHAFVADLLGRVAAALVSRWVDTALPQWRVEEPAAALADLGRRCRGISDAVVVGVTGSNGKTTVKELVAALLGRAGATLATAANYNNTLGVPLTLCRLDSRHRYAVVELGASAAGEIAPLAEWARPQVGVVTNASGAHLEGFGDLETVGRTKGELFAALPEDGVAVVNAGSPHRPAWREQIGTRRTLTFGADATAADVNASAARDGRIALRWPAGERTVSFPLLGAHNRWNAAAAVAAVLGAGGDPGPVLGALAGVGPVAGRLALHTLPSGARVIDDSYYANPASLDAGLDVLASFAGEHWLALGDMAELGCAAAERHAEAGERARQRGVSRLFATGALSRASAAAFGNGGAWFRDREQLARTLAGDLHGDVTVLVKGSRSAGMEAVVRALTAGERAGGTDREG